MVDDVVDRVSYMVLILRRVREFALTTLQYAQNRTGATDARSEPVKYRARDPYAVRSLDDATVLHPGSTRVCESPSSDSACAPSPQPIILMADFSSPTFSLTLYDDFPSRALPRTGTTPALGSGE